MADRKITDLTALAAGSQATGDLLTIVDVSEGAAADKNKKITVESLFKGIPSNVGIGTSSPTNASLVIEKVGFQVSCETGTSGDGQLRIGHFSDGAFIGTYGDDGGAADFIRFGTHSGDEPYPRIRAVARDAGRECAGVEGTCGAARQRV